MYQRSIYQFYSFVSLCFGGPSSDEPCRQQLSKAKLRSARPWNQRWLRKMKANQKKQSILRVYDIFWNLFAFFVQIVNFRIFTLKTKTSNFTALHTSSLCLWNLAGGTTLIAFRQDHCEARAFQWSFQAQGFVQAAESRCLDSLVCHSIVSIQCWGSQWSDTL